MIRVAEQGDVTSLLWLSLMFIQDSGYKVTPDLDKMKGMVLSFINDPDKIIFVIEEEDKVVGMLAGAVSPAYFSKDTVAQEIVWYVEPDHRGSKDSIKLIKTYENWARRMGCKLVQLSNIVDLNGDKVERLYTKLGYSKKESAFMKELI